MVIFTTILAWLGKLLGGPFAKAAVEAYGKKLDAENSTQGRVAELAAKELELEARERELSVKLAMSAPWWHPTNLGGFIIMIYFGKCVVWDKVLAHWTHGTTDPLTGDLQTWGAMIIAAYYGGHAVITATKVIRGR